MAKRLTRIEMKILAKTLTETAAAKLLARQKEREVTQRIHNARLMALSEKFLRKHGKQILALAVLNVKNNDNRRWRTGETPAYYLDADFPLKWTDDTEARRKSFAAEYSAFMQEMDFAPLTQVEGTSVHFTALDESAIVPSDEVQQWKNLADKIDMAVIDGDAKDIMNLIKEFTK